MNNFEFDKIVIAIAFAVFTVIFSSHIGNLLYIPEGVPQKPGFLIETMDDNELDIPMQNGLPDELDMKTIMASADALQGVKIFNKCVICHTNEKGGKNKIGPNLWGIVGKTIASNADYKYSKAMITQSKKVKNWSYEELYRYLYAPKKHVPGTKMAFAGVKDEVQRAGLIAYLRQMSDNPLPLP